MLGHKKNTDIIQRAPGSPLPSLIHLAQIGNMRDQATITELSEGCYPHNRGPDP